MNGKNAKREFGDYQTPECFANDICRYLKDVRGVSPSIIIEPTCGTGNFLKAATIFDAQLITGIEIKKDYCESCQNSIKDSRVSIINADFLSFDIKKLVKGREKVLFIGNPPWVTNSTLSTLGSSNIPPKSNFKGLNGCDALTGASNFDICEFIILGLTVALQGMSGTIAMLCKTSVARNVFKEMKRSGIEFTSCDLIEFNANRVFGISADACLLIIDFGNEATSPDFFSIFSFEQFGMKKKVFYNSGKLYNERQKKNCDFSGKSCFEWRQGIKHDCSKIMELCYNGQFYTNGLGEIVDIEPDYVYPLIKSSMYKAPIATTSNKYVIVTQKKIKQDTVHIRDDAPKTWKYLIEHKNFFEDRKSSIYKNSPPFSMFGVGEYSYAKYKVGVSGFYKKPLFSLLCATNDHPIMTDDTSYFICLPTFNTAYTVMLILNTENVQTFLHSIAFLDSKRPFTKKVLEQIDFHRILSVIQLADLKKTEKRLGLESRLTEEMLDEFKNLPEFM